MRANEATNGQSGSLPFGLHHDAWGQLVLTDAEGRSHSGVEIVRAFPLSDPHHGISICDARGKELVWIAELETLPTALARQIECELAQREFVPIIRRIVKVSAPVEPSEWEVETERGRTTFILNNEDDVHELDNHQALITDANGIRYLIPDLRRLDSQSQRLLERYL